MKESDRTKTSWHLRSRSESCIACVSSASFIVYNNIDMYSNIAPAFMI